MTLVSVLAVVSSVTVQAVAVQPALAHAEVLDPVEPSPNVPLPSSGFKDVTVISGLNLPTTIKFASNGDIFVAEKSGLIKRFTSLADTTPDIAANLQTDVMNFFDRGLLGLAIDPQYPQRPYIYALYSRDGVIGGPSPKWGNAGNGGNDTCPGSPNGPGPNVDGCVGSGRLLRLTIGPNGLATAQKTLVDGWCVQFPSHSIGTVAFGPDGYLYAGGGDGASYSATTLDYGQLGGTIINPNTNQPYTPKNPCDDPPGGVGGSMTLPTAEGGALRTQDKRTPNDPTALNGTIIRVDPDTGLAVSTNPSFASGHDENDRKIIAFGLRNPYRFTFRPGTNEVWIGDVGAESWEELDRIVNPTSAVKNFGWPCYEGDAHNANWDALNANLCENLYAAGSTAVQKPYFKYYHVSYLSSTDTCPRSGGVVSGVTYYTGNSYPARFKNALFLTDYTRRCIWAMKPGTNGLPDPTKIEIVEQLAEGPVDLVSGPNGDIFYVDHVGGTIHRLVYSAGNQPPNISATATPTSGPAPLLVQFDASATKDPEGNTITFAWDLDGDGVYNNGTAATAQKSYAAGTWLPSVRVTDSHGASSTRGFVITSGNSAPTPVIDSPQSSFHWQAGQTINFTGHATDPDQGALGAASLTWRVILHHCTGPTPAECHQHVIQEFDGTSSGSFQAQDHDLPAHLELRLTATDSGGLSTTVSVDLDPQTVDLTFSSNPTGLNMPSINGMRVTPFTRRFIVGGSVTVNAPVDQLKNGTYYTYSSWSDGGSRAHTFQAPAAPTTYTANYVSGLPKDAENTCASLVTTMTRGQWVYNTLSSSSDIDWYRVNVQSQTYTLITLGGLTANLKVELYSACGTLVTSSDRSGTRFEEIYRQLAAGTYFLKVSYVSGTVNANSVYGIRVSPLTESLMVLSSSSFTNSAGKQVVFGEVLNNTGDRQESVQVTATFYNAAHEVLRTASATTYVNVMPSRTRSPFKISINKPAGYDHYDVAVVTNQRSVEPLVGNLNISSSSITSATGPSFKGAFKNANSFSAHAVNSIVTLFDAWATVINVRSDATSPTFMPANSTATYSSTFTSHYAGWNYGYVYLEGTR